MNGVFNYSVLIRYLRTIKQVMTLRFKGFRQMFIVTDVTATLDIFHRLTLKRQQHFEGWTSLRLQKEEERGENLLWWASQTSWGFCSIQQFRLSLSKGHAG
jgi:hypothetical protein